MSGPAILKRIEFWLKYRWVLHRIRQHLRRHRPTATSVLIGGAPRSGKSTLAQELCRSAGYYPLDLDTFKPYLVACYGSADRQQQLLHLLSELFRQFPTGLCVEGSLLVYGPNNPVIAGRRVRKKYFVQLAANPTLSEKEKQDTVRNVVDDLPVHEYQTVADRYGVRMFIVSTQDSIEQKHQGILRFRATGECWSLAGASDQQVYYLAMQTVLTSESLHNTAHSGSPQMLEINSATFSDDIRQAVASILEHTRTATNPPAQAAA